MATIPKLTHTIDRFNQGCAFFNRAIKAWKDGSIIDFETSLRKAATEAVGALEWALKVYLRNFCRDRMLDDEKVKLKQPVFSDLMELMQKHATPVPDDQLVAALYGDRDLFRNPAEHDASIPSFVELQAALQRIRKLILAYLPVNPADLKMTTEAPPDEIAYSQGRKQYFDSLISKYEYMDLGGISPRVGSKVVKIRMDDLYVQLEAVEEGAISALSKIGSASLAPQLPFSANSPISTEIVDPSPSSIAGQSRVRGRRVRLRHILQKRAVVILGDPGAGKTTLGRYLAYHLAKGSLTDGKQLRQHVPVIVRPAEFALELKTNPALSFYDYVTSRYSARFGPLFKEALQRGLCLLIIDGLDEVPEAELRVVSFKRIEQFLADFQENRFIITSRIVGYRQNRFTGDLAHYTLVGLTAAQTRRFIENWHRAIEAEAGSTDVVPAAKESVNLWRAINSNPSIKKLAANPLLLTIIVLANWRGTKLPNRRVELYQIATETLIENWPLKQRGLELHSDEILRILEPIAFQIVSSGNNNLIGEHELRPIFEAQVCEVRGTTQSEAKSISRELLQTIEQHTGFFLERGLDAFGQKLYGFLHLTFAEYLAARHLAEQWSADQLDLRKYLHQSRWEEVVQLMAGHVGTWATAQATRLLTQIVEVGSPYESVLHRDDLLAARILCDNVRVKRDVQDSIISRLISNCLTSPHRPLWFITLDHLGRIAKVLPIGTETGHITISENDNQEIRFRKAVVLLTCKRDSEQALGILINGLVGLERVAELAEQALDSIIGLEDGAGECSLFIERPQSFMHVHLSRSMADRISKVGCPTSGIADLTTSKPLTEDTGRIWLLRPHDIKQLTTEEIIDVLGSGIWQMAIIAAELVKTGGSGLAFPKKLLVMLRDRDSKISRSKIIESLDALWANIPPRTVATGLQRRRFVTSLMEVAKNDEDASVRALAVKLLLTHVAIGLDCAAAFKLGIKDKDEAVRLAAINGVLGRRQNFRLVSLDDLRYLESDESRNVRRGVARLRLTLGLWKGDELASILEKAKGPVEPSARGEAFHWMSQLLTSLSTCHSAAHVREIFFSFVDYVAGLNAKEDIENAFFLLHDKNLRGRADIATLASGLFNSRVPALRYWGLQLWRTCRAKEADATLVLPLLKDPAVIVRKAAIRSLDDPGHLAPEAIEFLVSLIRDEREEATEASSALARVPEPNRKQELCEQMAAILSSNPNNTVAYVTLSDLVDDTDRFAWDE